jgi:hypothetical protein
VVENVLVEFRSAHDLVSAAQAEAWLAHRGLSADAWLDHFRRSVLRIHSVAELPAQPQRHAGVVGPLALASAFRVFAIGSKAAPSADDPAVAVRARVALVSEAVQRAVDEHVRWVERGP